jgi:hypothetical protein
VVLIPKLRNPRVAMFNVPQDNARKCCRNSHNKNPELDLKDLGAKFCYNTKGNTRHLVTEVDPGTRQKLMQAGIKLEWTICSVDDYVVARGRFRCSRSNPNFRDCKGKETCPMCTGSHKLKEYIDSKTNHKYINCLV